MARSDALVKPHWPVSSTLPPRDVRALAQLPLVAAVPRPSAMIEPLTVGGTMPNEMLPPLEPLTPATRLPVTVTPWSCALARSSRPPAYASPGPPPATLSATVLLRIDVPAPRTDAPPPDAELPLAQVPVARLSRIVTCSSVSAPSVKIPPPTALPGTAAPRPSSAWLSRTVTRRSVRCAPVTWIPPPSAGMAALPSTSPSATLRSRSSTSIGKDDATESARLLKPGFGEPAIVVVRAPVPTRTTGAVTWTAANAGLRASVPAGRRMTSPEPSTDTLVLAALIAWRSEHGVPQTAPSRSASVVTEKSVASADAGSASATARPVRRPSLTSALAAEIPAVVREIGPCDAARQRCAQMA